MKNSSESFTEINLITVTVIFCCAAIAGCAIFFLQEVTCGTKIFFEPNIDPILNEKIYIAIFIYLISIHFLYFGLTRDFLKARASKLNVQFRSWLGMDYTPAGIFLQFMGARARVLVVYPVGLFLFILVSLTLFYCSPN